MPNPLGVYSSTQLLSRGSRRNWSTTEQCPAQPPAVVSDVYDIGIALVLTQIAQTFALHL